MLRTRSVLLAALCALGLAACASEATPARTPSYQVRPVVAPPRLEPLWRVEVDPADPWEDAPQQFAAPLLVSRTEDLIVAGSHGHVARLRAGNGQEVWRVGLRDDAGNARVLHASPAISAKQVFVAALDGTVQALKFSSGEAQWQYRAEDAVEGALVASQDRLLFTDSREILYVLDQPTGKLLWRYQRRTPDGFTIKGGGTPVVDQDVVFVGFADGSLAALQLDTGDPFWIANLSGGRAEYTDVDLPVLLDGDTIYASTYASGVYALRPEDGSVRWLLPVENVSAMELVGDTLYLASAQGRVIAVDKVTREIKWSFRLREDMPVALTREGPYLFVSTSGGPLVVLDRHTGALRLRWRPSNGANTPARFWGRCGFSYTNSGALYAFTYGVPGGALDARDAGVARSRVTGPALAREPMHTRDKLRERSDRAPRYASPCDWIPAE